MNTQTKIAIGIILILVVGGSLLFFFRTSTLPITKYLDDGGSVTYTLEKFCSRFSVTLTSTNDEMNLKITVDGQTVYEKLPFNSLFKKKKLDIPAINKCILA